jgi:PAS domain S-box-containing protein
MKGKKINAIIVGGGKDSLDLITMFNAEESMNICAVIDPDPAGMGVKLAKDLGIPTSKNWKRFLKNPDLNEIIDTTGDPKVYAALVKEKPSGAGIMAGTSVKTILRLVEKKEELAKQLHKIISRVFERNPDIVVITDTKGNIEYVNANFTRISAYNFNEIYGTDVRALYSQSAQEAKQIWDDISYALNSGKEWQGELQVKKKDGRLYWEFATISALKDSQDRITHFLKIAVDISARKQAEEALQREYRTVRRIIENAPFGIYVVTEAGSIDYVNPAMLKITGESYKKFLHLNVFELPTFKNIGLTEKLKAGLQGEYFRINSVKYTSYYSKKTSIINFIGIPLEEDRIKKVLVIVEDITEQKKAEEELRSANEELKRLDQVKSDFISTVSHEFRTPLTAVREAVSQVLDGILGGLNKEQRQFLSIAMEDVERLWKIVGNLLDISKIEAGRIELKRTLVNICEVVKNVGYGFQNILQNKKLTLKFNLPKEGVDISIDTGKIAQVLSNLLFNACKFSSQGAAITISVTDKEKEVEVAVKDTGIGIAKANIPRLFDKFTQFGGHAGTGIKEKGSGLGLAISQGIVQLHGGRIWAESELNKGSTFTFILPKVSSERIFKEYIDSGIKLAMNEESRLALIVLKVEDFAKLDKLLKGIRARDILRELEENIRKVLRKNTDISLKDTGECVILLYDTDRLGATIVKRKIAELVRRYVGDFQKRFNIKLDLSTGMSIYPEEAKTSEELLLKAKVKLARLYLGTERRKHLRTAYRTNIKFTKAKGESAQSVDISEKGICIASVRPVKMGTKHNLVLELPMRFGPVAARAQTIWVKKVEETNEYRVGLHFIEMSNEDKKKLRKFLESGGD